MGNTDYDYILDRTRGIRLFVEFRTRRTEVLEYALVLVVEAGDGLHTVRVYDSAHGRNEMHRYTKRVGKQPAHVFHLGTLGEGMRAALEHIKRSYEEMIDGWHRG